MNRHNPSPRDPLLQEITKLRESFDQVVATQSQGIIAEVRRVVQELTAGKDITASARSEIEQLLRQAASAAAETARAAARPVPPPPPSSVPMTPPSQAAQEAWRRLQAQVATPRSEPLRLPTNLEAARQQFQQQTLADLRDSLKEAWGDTVRAEARAAALASPAAGQPLALQAALEARQGVAGQRERNATEGARASFLGTDRGQGLAQERAAVDAEGKLAEARQRSALLAGNVAHAESASGRQSAQSQAGEQARQQALGLRSDLAKLQARAAYETNPQGHAAGAEIRRLQGAKEAQEEALGRQRVIDEFGQLAGRLLLAREGLTKLTHATAATALATSANSPEALAMLAGGGAGGVLGGVLGRLLGGRAGMMLGGQIGAEVGAAGTVATMGLARTASPAQASTMDKSWELLRVAAGSKFTGMMDTLSYGFQRAAHAMGGQGDFQFQREPPSPYESRFLSPEQYADSIQLAINNQTPLDADIMQRRFANYINGLGGDADAVFASIQQNLERIADVAGRYAPAWRGD